MTYDGTSYLNCLDEQSFKIEYLKKAVNRKGYTSFCIETEETVKGFPDVMNIEKKTGLVHFQEFKYVRNNKIQFQPSQPAFYKAHPEMIIYVVAFDRKKQFIYVFDVKCLFDPYSPYKINEQGEVLV